MDRAEFEQQGKAQSEALRLERKAVEAKMVEIDLALAELEGDDLTAAWLRARLFSDEATQHQAWLAMMAEYEDRHLCVSPQHMDEIRAYRAQRARPDSLGLGNLCRPLRAS